MSGLNLTPKQVSLLVAVVAQLEQITVDWKAVADQADYTTAKYARDTWAIIKNRIKSESGGASGAGGAGGNAATKTTPKKRKAKEATSAEDAEDGDAEDAPKPKGRKKSTSKKAKKEEGTADVADDEEVFQ